MDCINLPVIWFILIVYIITSIPEVSLQGDECFTDSQGRDYRGIVSATQSGKTCQQWTSQSPHKHDRTPSNYPDAGLGDHNFCRNPDDEPGAWCYTTDDGDRWDLCDIGAWQVTCDMDLGCQEDWHIYSKYCYYVSDYYRDYNAANDDCVSSGSTLASIHSEEENQFIRDLGGTDRETDPIWIGLDDRYNERTFSWIDGSHGTYTNWDNGQPDDYNDNEDCVEMWSGGKWNDLDCIDQKRKYICKTQVMGCKQDWILRDEYCYYASDSERSYYDASTDCVDKSSNLTSVQNDGENDFVTGIVGGNAWIGFDDMDNEGTFTWIDGSSVTFTKWAKDEPNDSGGEDCTEIDSSKEWKWNDEDCETNQFYICKSRGVCVNLLGMKDGTIQDNQISASSEIDDNHDHGASNARLDLIRDGERRGGWSPATNDKNQWIQVDFGTLQTVSGIVMQGREDSDQWVTKYQVQHGTDGYSWQYVKDNKLDKMIFDGNSDRNTHVTSLFTTGVAASHIRVLPQAWHSRISLRLEILGCKAIPPITTPAPTTQITTTDFLPPTTTYSPTSYQPQSTSLTDVTPSTSANPHSTSVAARSPEPQIGGSSTAVIIGSLVGALLALLVAVILVCVLIRRKRRNGADKLHNLTPRKPLEFDGPYDMTIEGESKQPMYTNTCQLNGLSSEKQPVYANTNPADPSSEEVYQEVTETSRDEDNVTVYSTVESKDNFINSDTNKHLAVVYAKVDKDKGPIYTKDPLDNNDKEEEEGWEANVAYSGFQDENYAKVIGNDKEGWEDNALYGTGDRCDDKDKLNEEGTEGWKENDLYGTGDEDAVKDQTKITGGDAEGWEDNELYGDAGGKDMDTDTEGWEDNALYGDAAGRTDDQKEGWEDNAIYAGSDEA